MKIGFDLDKIFIDYPPLIPDVVIERLYRKKMNGSLAYRIPTRPEQALRRLSHVSLFRPPIHKNIEFLESIPKKEHRLYLISSRFRFLESVTLTLMKKYGFTDIFDGMYFNFDNEQPHLFKDKVLHQLKLDRYVDDDLHLLRFVLPLHAKTKFYWLNNNSGTKELEPNLYAISDLSCILG